MNHDTFSYCFSIESFHQLLIWLMLICAIGAVVIAYAMLSLSSFFFLLKKDGKSMGYKKFSTINFEIPSSSAALEALITGMSDKMKDTVRWKLKLDFYFMPFFYLLLYFIGVYCFRYWCADCQHKFSSLLWMPFIGWLMDFLENMTASSSLLKLTKTKSQFLYIFSLLKWVFILGFLVLLIVFAIWR